MSFRIFKIYPPDLESAVAQLTVLHGDIMDIPAEVFRVDGELMIRIFPRGGGEVWQYPLNKWLGAIQHAVEVLGPDG